MAPTSSKASMFVASHRCCVQPGREHDFIAHWQRITHQCLAVGSGGSRLFRDEQGRWVAIARPPTRDARDRFFSKRDDGAGADRAELARQAVIGRLLTQEFDSVLDLRVPPADSTGAVAP